MKSVFASLAVVVMSQFAAAQTYQTLPTGYLTTTGGEDSTHFIGQGNDYNSTISQSVYDTSNFADQGLTTISSIAFRAKPGSSAYAAGSLPMTIKMSSSTRNYNNLSNSFATNRGADVVTVFNGTVSYPAVGSTTTVNDWVVVNLTTPFIFQPSLGRDLCIEITKCSGKFARTIDCDDDGAAEGIHEHSCTDTSGHGNDKVPVFRIGTHTTCTAAKSILGAGCGLSFDGTLPLMGQLGTLSITGGDPFGPGIIAFSGPANMGSPWIYSGCNVYLDLASVGFIGSFNFDAVGNYSLTAPLPNDPFVECLETVLQSCQFGHVPLISNALWLRFGH